MFRHIPPFVLHKHEQGQVSGSFDGYAILFDTEDFTTISNVFRKEEKRGAEALGKFLSEIVSTPIHLVEKAGGFVCQYSGETFYAVFPDAGAACVHDLVDSITGFFNTHAPFATKIGEFPVAVRIFVSKGQINWRIFRNQYQHEFVFDGPALSALNDLRLERGQVVLSGEAKKTWETEGTERRQLPEYHFDPKTAAAFLHPRLHLFTPENEIARAAFCFISLAEIGREKLEATIASIHAKLDEYSGYLKQLYLSDKGLTALTLFGMPQATEHTPDSLCRFTLDLSEQIPELSFGLSWGSAFTGMVGRENRQKHVVIGATVILADRLLQRAGSGEMLTDNYLKEEMHRHFNFETAGALTMNGIPLPVRYFRLQQLAESKKAHHEGEFWGRKKESAWIRERLQASLHKNENSLILVGGKAGIGKSRLVSEALKTFPAGELNIFVIRSDARVHKPSDGMRQIVRSYFRYNPHMAKEAGMAMFRGLWAEFAGDNAELKRIESIIASLMRYTWKNSVWHLLPETEKLSQMQGAFFTFLQALAAQKPVVLCIDDLQWLDADSKTYLEALSTKGIAPLHIIACYQSKDEEDMPELNLAGHSRYDLDMEALDELESEGMVKTMLQVPELPEDTQILIWKACGGNPLHVEQVTRYLQESKCMNEQASLVCTPEMDDTKGINGIIQSRVNLVSPELRKCLTVAALLGREFDIRVLKEMIHSGEIVPELKEGEKLGWWQELDEFNHSFKNSLMADVIYELIESKTKKQMHLQAAEVSEIIFGKDKESLCKHAEEIARHYDLGEDGEKAAKMYLMAGYCMQETFELGRARKAFEDGIRIHRKMDGEESSNVVFFMEKLAQLLCNTRELSQAEEIFNRTLNIKKKRLGLEHIETAVSLNHMGNAYLGQGKLLEAEACYSISVDIRRKLLGEEHQNTLKSITSLAGIYHQLGKYDQAEARYNQTIDARVKLMGTDNMNTAHTLNKLGSLYYDQHRYEQAEIYHTKAWEARKKVLGAEHPDTADALTNLAKDCLCLKKYEQAEKLFNEAIGACERIFGMENPTTANNLHNLGSVYMDRGNTKRAETMYLKALEIRKKCLGQNDAVTLGSFNSIAILYYKMGMPEKSEAALQQSLDIAKTIFGAEHTNTARIMYNLATVRIKLGKYVEAEPLYLDALVKYESLYGLNHPDTKDTIKYIIQTYQYLKQPDKVAEYRNLLHTAENKRR